MANPEEFHDEQKFYLQGFLSGSDLARGMTGLPTFAATLGTVGNTSHEAQPVGNGKAAGGAEPVPTGPDAIATEPHRKLWPDVPVIPFHYTHPVTGKPLVAAPYKSRT